MCYKFLFVMDREWGARTKVSLSDEHRVKGAAKSLLFLIERE